MNKRQVIILCIVAIILAAAVAVMKFTGKETVQSTTARAAGETLFGKFPASEIASVAITGVDGTVTIEQKDGKWTLAERDLILSALKARQLVGDVTSYNEKAELPAKRVNRYLFDGDVGVAFLKT